MARRVVRLTLDSLADLPDPVRECVLWELDPVRRAVAVRAGAAAAEKEAWLSATLLAWGSCGRVVLVEDEPVGVVLYAPPGRFPGTAVFPTAPLADDAVQLATAWVRPDHRGGGIGRLLMQEMVKDLVQRGGVRAVECIGARPGVRQDCLLPVEFLGRVGFKTHRAHPRTPRMRLELASVLTWRAELEAALERLRGAVRPVPRRAPALPTRVIRRAGSR